MYYMIGIVKIKDFTNKHKYYQQKEEVRYYMH